MKPYQGIQPMWCQRRVLSTVGNWSLLPELDKLVIIMPIDSALNVLTK